GQSTEPTAAHRDGMAAAIDFGSAPANDELVGVAPGASSGNRDATRRSRRNSRSMPFKGVRAALLRAEREGLVSFGGGWTVDRACRRRSGNHGARQAPEQERDCRT